MDGNELKISPALLTGLRALIEEKRPHRFPTKKAELNRNMHKIKVKKVFYFQ